MKNINITIHDNKIAKKEVFHIINEMNEKYYFPINIMRANCLFVLWENEIAVAFLGLNQRNGYWYIRGSYVEEKYRGNGYQIKLCEKAFEYLKNKGINRVSSLIKTDNIYSLNNAKKIGFQIKGREKENFRVIKLL